MKEEETAELNILTQEQQAIVQTIEHSCQEQKLHSNDSTSISSMGDIRNHADICSCKCRGRPWWKYEFNFQYTLALGILCGLVIGKQIGITLFAWISVKVD